MLSRLMKFATGRPKPLLLKPPPAIVNDAGALARSIGLGLMPVTHSGHGRVSLTVSAMLDTNSQRVDSSHLYISYCTVCVLSTDSGPFSLFVFVGNGTVRIVFPFFFFNDTATTEIYPLTLHAALPI